MKKFLCLGAMFLSVASQLSAATYCSLDGKTRCTIEYVSEEGQNPISIDEESKEALNHIMYKCETDKQDWGFLKFGGGKIRAHQKLTQEDVNTPENQAALTKEGLKGTIQSGEFWGFSMSDFEDVGIFRLFKVTTDEMNFVVLSEAGGSILIGAKEFCK